MPPRTSGLVLAAGGSQRLGRPKQLLPFGAATLLDHTLATGRATLLQGAVHLMVFSAFLFLAISP